MEGEREGEGRLEGREEEGGREVNQSEAGLG